MKHFYAAEYAYGRVARNDGQRTDTLMVFDSEEARDKWVAGGPDYFGESGYRESLYASEARQECGRWAFYAARRTGDAPFRTGTRRRG